jgi:hypothetical protein
MGWRRQWWVVQRGTRRAHVRIWRCLVGGQTVLKDGGVKQKADGEGYEAEVQEKMEEGEIKLPLPPRGGETGGDARHSRSVSPALLDFGNVERKYV